MKSQCKNCPSDAVLSQSLPPLQSQSPKVNKVSLGLQGFDTLVDIYLSNKKNMTLLNKVAQAKTKDFESPLIMSSAILMARQYIAMVQKLGSVVPVIASDYFNLRMRMAAELNILSKNAPQVKKVVKKKAK